MAEDIDRSISIRIIKEKDNIQVSQLIVSVMSDYGCIGEGYSSSDPELENMYVSYDKEKHAFYVIVDDLDNVLGCGGIAPLTGADDNTCELRKMYFYQKLRGRGYGRQLMDLLLQQAAIMGYLKCYLETVERMKSAGILYAKYGFLKLPSSHGDTGHCGCDVHMIKELV